jgi:hypothetical protein
MFQGQHDASNIQLIGNRTTQFARLASRKLFDAKR